jgi:hypothetical protein
LGRSHADSRCTNAAAAGLVEPDESGVYAGDDVSLGLWLDSFKFDLDELTFGVVRPDQPPTPAITASPNQPTGSGPRWIRGRSSRKVMEVYGATTKVVLLPR